MAAVITQPPRIAGTDQRRPLPRRDAHRRIDPGRATLDDRITALWAELIEAGTADCPVCGDEVVAGRPCASCGSELS